MECRPQVLYGVGSSKDGGVQALHRLLGVSQRTIFLDMVHGDGGTEIIIVTPVPFIFCGPASPYHSRHHSYHLVRGGVCADPVRGVFLPF